jgi:hypothetical protein
MAKGWPFKKLPHPPPRRQLTPYNYPARIRQTFLDRILLLAGI